MIVDMSVAGEWGSRERQAWSSNWENLTFTIQAIYWSQPETTKSKSQTWTPRRVVKLVSRTILPYGTKLMIPGFWLPLLARTVAKVTGVTDYNIVQNNGARAAQVVPHVHFHIIPRPATMPEIKSKSWTMFGRGQRDDLDDEEGARLAGEMRRVLRGEIAKVGKSSPRL